MNTFNLKREPIKDSNEAILKNWEKKIFPKRMEKHMKIGNELVYK
jgi:hypothetical protein